MSYQITYFKNHQTVEAGMEAGVIPVGVTIA